jgi:arylsulfatase
VFAGRSFTIDADVELAKAHASGAVIAVGSRFAGMSLYLDDGRPSFVYALSTRPQDTTRITAARRLGAGAGKLRLRLASEGVGKGAEVQILDGAGVLASGHVPQTFLTAAGIGEMLDVGRDSGVTVTDYRTPHGELEGEVRHVSVAFD